MNYDILIIDWSNLVYRAGHAGQRVLTCPNTGIVTNTFHYTFTMLEKLLMKFNPGKLVIAMDNPYFSYARKTIWPEYKGLRKTVQDDNHRRIGQDLKTLCGIIQHFPSINIYWDDLEADDVIAWCCNRAWQSSSKLVVSTDKDMMQLVSDQSHVYYPGKVERLVTPASWVEHMSKLLKLDDELVPRMDQYVEFKCIMGEAGASSDNVPGIQGFGPKKTAQFLKEFDTFANALAVIPGKAKPKVGELRVLEEDWQNIFKRNGVLMDLNQFLDDNASGLRIFNGTYDAAKMYGHYQQWSLAKVASGQLGNCFSRLAENSKVTA